jgi:ABC-type lipoprotein export system ATPase subunit
VLELLFDQAERNKTTMLMVTHDSSILDRFDRTVDLAELQIADTSTEVK